MKSSSFSGMGLLAIPDPRKKDTIRLVDKMYSIKPSQNWHNSRVKSELVVFPRSFASFDHFLGKKAIGCTGRLSVSTRNLSMGPHICKTRYQPLSTLCLAVTGHVDRPLALPSVPHELSLLVLLRTMSMKGNADSNSRSPRITKV